MPAAALKGDTVMQTALHCHMPHPTTPPAPQPHPMGPLKIQSPCCPLVKISTKDAACVGDLTEPCKATAPCVPAPGVIQAGSGTVQFGGRAAARMGDATLHAGCIGAVPCTAGKITAVTSTVIIGG